MESNNYGTRSIESCDSFSEKFWSIAKKVLVGVSLALAGAAILGPFGAIGGGSLSAILGADSIANVIWGSNIGLLAGTLGGVALGGTIGSRV